MYYIHFYYRVGNNLNSYKIVDAAVHTLLSLSLMLFLLDHTIYMLLSALVAREKESSRGRYLHTSTLNQACKPVRSTLDALFWTCGQGAPSLGPSTKHNNKISNCNYSHCGPPLVNLGAAAPQSRLLISPQNSPDPTTRIEKIALSFLLL